MIIQTLKITICLAILWTFAGCELYYLPPHIQTPAHTKKGDIALNVQGLYTGSASASYAFSDHGFLGASYMGYSASNTDSFSNDFFRVTSLEGGYYDYDDETNLHLQVSGGFGTGTVGDPTWSFAADFSRFYIQPSIGFISENKNFENHLTLRVSHIAYERQVSQNVDPFQVQFIEPAYTFRGGSENLKLQMQVGLSIPIHAYSNVPVDFFHDPFIFGIGVQANFNIFKKPNKVESVR